MNARRNFLKTAGALLGFAAFAPSATPRAIAGELMSLEGVASPLLPLMSASGGVKDLFETISIAPGQVPDFPLEFCFAPGEEDCPKDFVRVCMTTDIKVDEEQSTVLLLTAINDGPPAMELDDDYKLNDMAKSLHRRKLIKKYPTSRLSTNAIVYDRRIKNLPIPVSNGSVVELDTSITMWNNRGGTEEISIYDFLNINQETHAILILIDTTRAGLVQPTRDGENGQAVLNPKAITLFKVKLHNAESIAIANQASHQGQLQAA